MNVNVVMFCYLAGKGVANDPGFNVQHGDGHPFARSESVSSSTIQFNGLEQLSRLKAVKIAPYSDTSLPAVTTISYYAK